TGGRKSLSFILLAASYLGRVTIMVVLLILLQGDLIEWCRKIKILYAKWRSN
ncbi:uncharacterized protein FOBCDRAFT_142377, partial [Fusarium oxysporum Fo47]|uniref:uncharacterized protein n=1 Tax=Fusarium oxysporum Fo47 TaxID=660027 RepID=UPI002869EADD